MQNNNSTLRAWLPSAPWLFALGFLFWFSSLSLFNLGIDQEIALFRTDQTAWLQQGRWVTFLIAHYLYPQQVLYFFPHVLFILSSIGAYVLILNAYAISTQYKKEALFLFPLFCAHPFWYLINEFYANIAATSLGLFCTAAAVWLYQLPATRLSNYIKIPLQVLLIAIAIGTYQSFLFLAFVFYVGTLLFTTEKPTLRCTLKQLLCIGLYMVAGVILYQIIQKSLQSIYDAPTTYLNLFINLEQYKEHSRYILNTIFKGIQDSYLGAPKVYRYSLAGYGVLFVLGVLCYLIKGPQTFLSKLGLILIILVSPFSLNFLSGQFYYTMPLRTFVAVPFVAWLFAWIAISSFQNKRLKTLLLALVFCANIQLLHVHSAYSSARIAVMKHDNITATLLLNRINELLPVNDTQHSYTLDVHGGLPYQSPYKHIIHSVSVGSFFNWDDGNAVRISAYLHYLNSNLNLEASTPAQHQNLLPIYQSMPTWPAPGSVQLHGQTILVKFQN